MRVQVPVSYDECMRIQALQDGKQVAQALQLLGRACVGGLSLWVESAFVADADGAAVETFCVCTDFAQQARMVERAVATDVEVVACHTEAAGTVVAFQLSGCVGLVATGGRTVYDQEAYAVYEMAQQLLFAFQKRMKAVDEIPRQACRRGREVQFGCFHRLMQDWMPKAPSRAVTAAATTFRTMFHTFRFCSAGLDIGFYFN